MGVVSFIRKILFGKKQPERFNDLNRFESIDSTIQSDLNRNESIRIDSNRSESMNQSIESLKSTIISSKEEEKQPFPSTKNPLKLVWQPAISHDLS